MECLGPQCASMLLDWLKSRLAESAAGVDPAPPAASRQGTLWRAAPYQDESPAIRTAAELDGAVA